MQIHDAGYMIVDSRFRGNDGGETGEGWTGNG